MNDVFLRAIIDRPDDDLPRRIYSDWLDEHGDIAQAEFIRIQCDLAIMEKCSAYSKPGGNHPFGPCNYCKLWSRKHQLLEHNIGAWTDFLPEELITKECPDCLYQSPDYETNAIECSQCDGSGFILNEDNITFKRGFVAEIVCSWDDFEKHSKLILSRCPIRNAKDGFVDLLTYPNQHFWTYTEDDDLNTCSKYPGVKFKVPNIYESIIIV